MELRQVRYFVSIAKLGSFSEASKSLFISQSTLSQQLRQLEDELDAPLLIRDSRHVYLSDYGRQFLPLAEQMLKDAESGMQVIRDVRNLEAGTLNIGATYTFCPLLEETIRSFIKTYPRIHLNVCCASMEELMKKLSDREVDVVLSYKPSGHYDFIESNILFNNDLCAVVSRDNPLHGRDSIRLSELEKFPLALPAKGLQARNTFDSLLYGQNYKFDVRIEMNDINMLLDLVAGSSLTTLVSRATVRHLEGLKTIALDAPNCDMEGAYHILKGTYCKKSAKVFLKLLIETNSFYQALDALE